MREEVAQVALKERPASGVLMQEKMAMVTDHQGLEPTEGGVALVRDRPAQVEAAAANVLPCANGIRVTEAEPRPEDALGGDALAPESSRGPGSLRLGGAAPGDVILAPESSDIVGSGTNELGLPGYPRAPPPPAS
jgi:hypothetical protein